MTEVIQMRFLSERHFSDINIITYHKNNGKDVRQKAMKGQNGAY